MLGEFQENHFLSVVECAIEHNNKFLIIRRVPSRFASNILAFPGGKVDVSDAKHQKDILKEAVIREVREEIGLELKDPVLYVLSNYFKGTLGHQVIDTIFYVKLENTVLDVKPSNREVEEYYWMTPEELLTHKDLSPWLEYYISAVVEFSSGLK